MAMLNMTLSTPPTINQDVKLELINQVTLVKTTVAPFLDGTVRVANLDPGLYRVTVKHPNIPSVVWDNQIRVFPDKTAFVPIKIPPGLFTDTPIREPTEADLSPVRDRLGHDAEQADLQAKKKGGQPIYADDWNALANVVGDMARSTSDLTRQVAPLGHHHPELEAKMSEIQSNLNKFLDLFGRTVAQLQREIRALSLRRQVGDALATIPATTAAAVAKRAAAQAALNTAIDALADRRDDTPFAYTSEVRRLGDLMTQTIGDMLPVDQPDVRNKPEVTAATNVAFAMSTQMPAYTYGDEMAVHQRIDAQSKKAAVAVAFASK